MERIGSVGVDDGGGGGGAGLAEAAGVRKFLIGAAGIQLCG